MSYYTELQEVWTCGLCGKTFRAVGRGIVEIWAHTQTAHPGFRVLVGEETVEEVLEDEE